MTGMMSAHETFQQAMIQEIKDEVKKQDKMIRLTPRLLGVNMESWDILGEKGAPSSRWDYFLLRTNMISVFLITILSKLF